MWLEHKIFSMASARCIVAISGKGKAEIEGLFGTPADRVALVYNGVDLARFHPDGRERLRPGIRASLGLPASAWVIAFIGSGFERKGLGPLLQGWSLTADRRSRLVVAGKGRAGEYRALAARLGVEDRLTWLGPRPDVERLYAAADVVALPARYEPFGNVHLEALASGVPVLSSRGAGGAELIRPGANGWVVEAPEAGAVALGLDRLRDADAARLRSAARASAEPFTYEAQVESLDAIYRNLTR